jgi:hypothetical protein
MSRVFNVSNRSVRDLLARVRAGALAATVCLVALTASTTLARAADTGQLAIGLTPVLSVSGETVTWAPVGAELTYRVAISTAPRSVSPRVTTYFNIPRKPGETQSYTLSLEPGKTAYVGVSADGVTWSANEAVVTVPLPPPPPPPPPGLVLEVNGETISWTAIPGVTRYTLATVLNPQSTRNTTYTVVTGTSYTPPAVPGQTVNYGLSASVPGTAPWAKEVSIAYPSEKTNEPEPEGGSPAEPPTGSESEQPAETPTEQPAEPPAETSGGQTGARIIGIHDGAGWGATAARTFLAGHITWNRVEIGNTTNTLASSLGYGFKVLAIVDNVADGKPLSQIEPARWGTEAADQILGNPGIAIAEAGNEMYYKGGVANPVQYGRMYLAAVVAMKAAGIHTPLLFNMWGDYPKGSNSSPTGWSQDANGGGWLRDAVNGVPGLAAAILANGLSTHPYGALGENSADEQGVKAVAAQESVAKTVLGATPPLYITEFGYAMSRCGAPDGACSQLEQATKMGAAYEAFLSDPHVAGIWWYESHDDSNGSFGVMNNDNTTRPSFSVLSSISQQQGW